MTAQTQKKKNTKIKKKKKLQLIYANENLVVSPISIEESCSWTFSATNVFPFVNEKFLESITSLTITIAITPGDSVDPLDGMEGKQSIITQVAGWIFF